MASAVVANHDSTVLNKRIAGVRAGGKLTGGKLRSVMHNDLIWDEGANTMTEVEPEVGSLLDDLGLREKQQFSISQKKRYIVRNGLPVMIPTKPIALVTSSVLSSQSKFQILLEPFLWKIYDSSSTVSDTSGVDCFRSIIVGAIRTKFAAKGDKSSSTRSSLTR